MISSKDTPVSVRRSPYANRSKQQETSANKYREVGSVLCSFFLPLQHESYCNFVRFFDGDQEHFYNVLENDA